MIGRSTLLPVGLALATIALVLTQRRPAAAAAPSTPTSPPASAGRVFQPTFESPGGTVAVKIGDVIDIGSGAQFDVELPDNSTAPEPGRYGRWRFVAPGRMTVTINRVVTGPDGLGRVVRGQPTTFVAT